MADIKTICLDLLKANHNIILSGAPGTGKTYMAKQIALFMTGSEDRIGFVQFHPSYDYTDFVEGLRPTPTSGSTIGFERKDGIFKEFCEKALPKKTLKEAYEELIEEIKLHGVIRIPSRTKSVEICLSSRGLIQGYSTTYAVSYDRVEKIANKYPHMESLEAMRNIDEEITAIIGRNDQSLHYAVQYEIYRRMSIHPYVFIIDEINRGEMSKVFGELFFSIDPGYRGENGAVRTQYANMVSSPNAFDKVLGKTDPKDYGYFFVPENVYIIGTMNDIDRSVDSMDFAMRRRFLIKDIKAGDTQDDMLKLDTIKDIYPTVTAIESKVVDKMDALNKVIEGKSEKKIKAKLGSSYSLGASYFQKYYKYNDFKLLWEYHLEGILREYLRGTQDPEGDLKILKEVYDNA